MTETAFSNMEFADFDVKGGQVWLERDMVMEISLNYAQQAATPSSRIAYFALPR